MILGITGGTGCGKTPLLSAIAEAGGLILDCDAIYHELLTRDNALLGAIESRFPGTVENGALQRKKLGSIVFADEQALLDEKLRQLALREDGAEIAIRYFCPDERKTGGSILSLQGHFLRLDPQARLLVLQEGSVPIDRLLALENIE